MTFEFPELETLTFEEPEPGVGVLRINRPDRMNSQTVTMFHEYLAAGRALRDSGLRALILTGTGGSAPSAPASISTRSTSSPRWGGCESS